MHKIQNYTENYFDQICSLWNEVFIYDKISSEKLHRDMIENEGFDEKLIKLVIKDETLIGFVWSAIEENKGFIVAIAIKDEYQNNGIGTGLIKEIEKAFINWNIWEVIVGPYSSVYVFPGIDSEAYPKAIEFFSSNNFEIGNKVYSMSKDSLYIKEINSKAKFERMNNENVDSVIAFLKKEFPGWEKNIQRLDAQNNFNQPVVIAYINYEIIGVAQSGFNGDINRFGPIGIKDGFRDFGIGQRLFEAMENEMVKEGLKNFYFLQAAERVKNFYIRNGMKIKRTYLLCSKNLD